MASNFTGRWKADLSQSKLLGPVPKAMTVAIAHSDPDLRQEIVVTKQDGSEEDELIIELWMQHGERELYLCDCRSLSPDGQMLTMEHRNDALAGQVAVLHRISD